MSGYVEQEAAEARKRLSTWARPERVSTPWMLKPGRSEIRKEPLGVVLIMSPWNYPVQLCLAPLVGALAAGNAAVLKPSEVTPATSAALARWVPEYLDPEAVQVVEGGVPETTALLAHRFDHIFYTGNGRVGRIVMQAAARHLTPVTLELGGKSPVLVDRTADLTVAARRIVWGKFFNAGQTCVAPDHVWVEEAVHDAFVQQIERAVRERYPDGGRIRDDYTAIVDERHHARLVGLLEGSGRVLVGGRHDAASRWIEPTVLVDVPDQAPVMDDEIFGPILPILPVRDVDEAIRRVNQRASPLALYVFSSDPDTQDHVLTHTSSGGALVNHCIQHLMSPELPFGGVGESGMGAYHGRSSFDVFSHRKSVLRKPFWFDPQAMYRPVPDATVRWVERMIGWWRAWRR